MFGIFIWTFHDVVGIVVLSVTVLGFLVYGTVLGIRSIVRKIKGRKEKTR